MNVVHKYRTALIAALLAALAGCLSASPVTLTLTPSGDLTGMPGDTVGWGFSIYNGTQYYVEFSSSNFCVSPVIPNSCTAPTTGAFTDIIVNNDPIIAPGDTLSQSFDPVGFTTGLGYFAIDPGATLLSSDLGQIVLTYDGYNSDPSVSPDAVQYLFSQGLYADASVTVSPEPATSGLLAVSLPGLAWMYTRARRRRRKLVR